MIINLFLTTKNIITESKKDKITYIFLFYSKYLLFLMIPIYVYYKKYSDYSIIFLLLLIGIFILIYFRRNLEKRIANIKIVLYFENLNELKTKTLLSSFILLIFIYPLLYLASEELKINKKIEEDVLNLLFYGFIILIFSISYFVQKYYLKNFSNLKNS